MIGKISKKVGMVVLVAAVSSVASVLSVKAAIPNNSDQLIYACYKTGNANGGGNGNGGNGGATSLGALRVIDNQLAGQGCTNLEQPINWPSQAGAGGGGGGAESAYLFLNPGTRVDPPVAPTINAAASKNVVIANSKITEFPNDGDEGTPADARHYRFCLDLTFVPKWSEGGLANGNPFLTSSIAAACGATNPATNQPYDAFYDFEGFAPYDRFSAAFFN